MGRQIEQTNHPVLYDRVVVMKTEVNMGKQYITTISIVTVLMLIVVMLWINNNNELDEAVADHREELAGKDQRIADLTSTNKTLEALIRQQKRLIEGESLGEFMEMYEKNQVATSVEILVKLENSETGLPMRFAINGCGETNEEDDL